MFYPLNKNQHMTHTALRRKQYTCALFICLFRSTHGVRCCSKLFFFSYYQLIDLNDSLSKQNVTWKKKILSENHFYDLVIERLIIWDIIRHILLIVKNKKVKHATQKNKWSICWSFLSKIYLLVSFHKQSEHFSEWVPLIYSPEL